MGDRGELLSTQAAQNIIRSPRVEIENAASGRADLKALVERRFGTVPAIFKQFVPGYVLPDFKERGARDYRLDAALNLQEFTSIVIYAVLRHNSDPITGHSTPAEMTTEGLESCPLDLWNWGIANRSGLLRIASIDEVSLAVMPRDFARVTAQGILFKGAHYSCPTSIQSEWFAAARQRTWRVPISYDPRSLTAFYIRDPTLPLGYEQCNLINPHHEHEGKSLSEIEELEHGRKAVQSARKVAHREKHINYDYQMDRIAREAKAKTKAARSNEESGYSMVKSIRANKAAEKIRQRQSESLLLETPPGTAIGNIQSTPPAAPTQCELASELERLRSKRATRDVGGSDAEDE
jgi:hypothetical protein